MEIINGQLYADMIRCGADNLCTYRTVVNDLNVFPIPDGDTGDNMYLTISSGYHALPEGKDSLGDVSSAAAYGMLLGARGNSGVILSRIFSGMAKSLTGHREVSIGQFGEALACGVQEAYGAVPVPVEGTILTVCREAVRFANDNIRSDSTVESYFDDLTAELKRSLDKTPELLDVLKQAGVVDSGGAGLVYIAEGMRSALNPDASARPAFEEGRPVSAASSGPSAPDFSKFGPDSVLTFGYCTEFLLRLQNAKTDLETFDLDALIRYLNGIGDSLVCFREGSIVKVHVHTRIPGDVLNHCQQYGEFLSVKIENMTIQHEETTIQNNYSAPAPASSPAKPHKRFGFVAVASGEGLQELFRSLGADAVIEGGQSMNPSAEDFLAAFSSVNADAVFVFPNNGNVILTAKQAASLCEDKDVYVIPTKDIGQGYCALSMVDGSSDDPAAIEEDLCGVIHDVVTACVSVASRDTAQNGLEVRKGQFIGFVGDTIHCAADTPEQAALDLAEACGIGDYDVLLLLKGCDVSEADAEALSNRFTAAYKRTETILQNGGQPIYHYILILQ